MTDILFVQLLRHYVETLPKNTTGFLKALKDEQIGRALGVMPSDPKRRWTAGDLASEAGMSRSSFYTKFSHLVGEPPLQYLTRWRMLTAADLLCKAGQSSAQIAEQVSYESEDAFSKAFRRQLGVSPSVYRRKTALPHSGLEGH